MSNKLNTADLNSNIDRLESCIVNYKNRIKDIKSLVNTIDGSSSWKEHTVKENFISVCNNYVEQFELLIESLNTHIDYLKTKAKSMEENEETYIGG